MPTYPREPEKAHKTRCSRTFLWPAQWWVLQQSEEQVPICTHQGEEAWGMPWLVQSCTLQQGWCSNDTQKNLAVCLSYLPSSLGLPCGTCPSTPSPKLNQTRWRLYATGLGLQLETTDPVAFWVNYKIVSLGTSLASALGTAELHTEWFTAQEDEPYRAQSCCSASLNHHVSSCHRSQHPASSFWWWELQETTQRAPWLTAELPFQTSWK